MPWCSQAKRERAYYDGPVMRPIVGVACCMTQGLLKAMLEYGKQQNRHTVHSTQESKEVKPNIKIVHNNVIRNNNRIA